VKRLVLVLVLPLLVYSLAACSPASPSVRSERPEPQPVETQEKPYVFDSARWMQSSPHPRDLAEEIVERGVLTSMTAAQAWELLGRNDSANMPIDPTPEQLAAVHGFGWSLEGTQGLSELSIQVQDGRILDVRLSPERPRVPLPSKRATSVP